jgi:hypothetical protein
VAIGKTHKAQKNIVHFRAAFTENPRLIQAAANPGVGDRILCWHRLPLA